MNQPHNKNASADTQIKRVAVCGMAIAIAVILDGFFKVPVNLFGAYALKLAFGMAPVIFISIRYGPLYGGFCGAIMDFLQAILFPMGAFNPLFTISAFVMGFIPGLICPHRMSAQKIRFILGIAAGQLVGSVLLSTLFLVISYGLPWAIIWPRVLTQAIMVPVYAFVVRIMLKLEVRKAY